MMKRRRPLPLLLAAVLVSGCGVGRFSPNATYRPQAGATKAFGAYGIGVLPVEDARPEERLDSRGGGGSIVACILIGGFLPRVGGHIEHIESGASQILNSYDPAQQRLQRAMAGGGGAAVGMKRGLMAQAASYESGGVLDPLQFIRQDLVSEFAHNKMLGPAQPIDAEGQTPFTLKATLRSSKVTGHTFCYLPMDTTWIFWMLGLPFSHYDFDLKLDLALLGPGGGEPLWTYTIDAKSGGTTGFYYATGVTDENNLEQIYNDMLSQAMAKAAGDLEGALAQKRPEFWQKIQTGGEAARPARKTEEEAGKPAEKQPEGQQPWWKQ